MTQAANLGALGTNVSSTGNLASPTFTGQATIPTINLTGGQITFPATQVPSADANTLDDYEEGTFTPTLYGTSSDPTIVYSGQTGRYIKIGKLVYIFFFIGFTSKSGGGGNMRMTLPFTSNGASNNYPGILIQDSGAITWGAGYTTFNGEVYPNNTLLYFIVSGSNVSSSALNTGAFGSTAYFYGSGVYEAAN
jgi:hypothetical protein